MRCPTARTRPDGEPHTIVGCGSDRVVGPDFEGLFDCLECGIWFDPAEETWYTDTTTNEGGQR